MLQHSEATAGLRTYFEHIVHAVPYQPKQTRQMGNMGTEIAQPAQGFHKRKKGFDLKVLRKGRSINIINGESKNERGWCDKKVRVEIDKMMAAL